MSVHVSNAVWRKSKHAGSELIVLLALADWADDEGRSWHSVGSLAGRSRLGVRGVQKVLTRLVGSGEVEISQQGAPEIFVGDDGRQRRPNLYRVTLADKDGDGVNCRSQLPDRTTNSGSQLRNRSANGRSRRGELQGTPSTEDGVNETPDGVNDGVNKNARRGEQASSPKSSVKPSVETVRSDPSDLPGDLRVDHHQQPGGVDDEALARQMEKERKKNDATAEEITAIWATYFPDGPMLERHQIAEAVALNPPVQALWEAVETTDRLAKRNPTQYFLRTLSTEVSNLRTSIAYALTEPPPRPERYDDRAVGRLDPDTADRMAARAARLAAAARQQAAEGNLEVVDS